MIDVNASAHWALGAADFKPAPEAPLYSFV